MQRKLCIMLVHHKSGLCSYDLVSALLNMRATVGRSKLHTSLLITTWVLSISCTWTQG